MALTKPKFGIKQIIVQGVENLFGAGECFNIAPLEPTVSRSLREIRTSRQDNWNRHQRRMKALRERRQTCTVDAYLHRALQLYAQQQSEHGVPVHGQTAQPIRRKESRASSGRLVTSLPPPKRRNRAK